MTRVARAGEIRCASVDYGGHPELPPKEKPRCENVAEFHWVFRDGTGHQVVCDHHARALSRIGHLERVTADNPAVVTEQMVIHWGSPEESAAASDAWFERSLAEGRIVHRDGLLYCPDGTTKTFAEFMRSLREKASE